MYGNIQIFGSQIQMPVIVEHLELSIKPSAPLFLTIMHRNLERII